MTCTELPLGAKEHLKTFSLFPFNFVPHLKTSLRAKPFSLK